MDRQYLMGIIVVAACVVLLAVMAIEAQGQLGGGPPRPDTTVTTTPVNDDNMANQTIKNTAAIMLHDFAASMDNHPIRLAYIADGEKWIDKERHEWCHTNMTDWCVLHENSIHHHSTPRMIIHGDNRYYEDIRFRIYAPHGCPASSIILEAPDGSGIANNTIPFSGCDIDIRGHSFHIAGEWTWYLAGTDDIKGTIYVVDLHQVMAEYMPYLFD